ncbi:MAG: HD domain-containing protein [Desulfovibrio sp.]|nr:HD domain-containing protein [Desulfovibrio sp.]MBI4961040.1 HD domain-containing protein [Desulfovibrio sp.]
MIEKHISWFEEYVQGFLTGNPEDDGHLLLKREHSLKVLAEARAITSSLGLSGQLTSIAHLAALYHDAGRFPQYRTYKTFKDSLSANHAHLGAKALRSNPFLNDLGHDMRVLVLGSVAMHNRRDLPGGISPELDTVTRIVRDSDKLDITRIMLDYLRPGGKRSDVVTLHVIDDPERYSEAIVDQIRAGNMGDYALMRYENDFKLLLISWVFDLNFKASRRAFLERGHADELFDLLPRTEELTQLRNSIYAVLNR